MQFFEHEKKYMKVCELFKSLCDNSQFNSILGVLAAKMCIGLTFSEN